MAKFCTQCGNELDENAVICPKCGTNFGQMPTATENKSNGMAIAGFILSLIFPLELLGLIFSIIGLSKANKTGNKKGLAIAGIIISLALIFIIPIIIVITIPSVLTTMNTAKQKSYENSLQVIEEYAQKQYDMCALGIESYDKSIFSENNCKLQYDYSTYLIQNAGFSTDDIKYVTISETNSHRIEITSAADGTGKFEGAKFEKIK